MSGTVAEAGGVVIAELSVAIAHLARRGGAGRQSRMAHALGLPLPAGASLTRIGPLRVLGIAPGRWLALREPADHDFAADLAALLKTDAAVCDVSDAYVILRLQGSAVRATLARLIAIDLHDSAFAVDRVAATVAAHIPVTLWRLPDEPAVTFELAVARSYAASWREMLAEAAVRSGAPPGG